MDHLKELLTQGFTRQAREEAKSLLAKEPENLSALITLAKAHLVEGELPEAEKLIAKAEKVGGINAETLVCRASLAGQRNDLVNARRLFEHAAAKDPKNAGALHGLGIMQAADGDFADSLKSFQAASVLAPQAGIIHYHLARNLIELDRPAEGVDHIEKAIRFNPLYPPAYLVFSRLLTLTKKLDGAKQVVLEGLKHNPNNPRLLAELTNVELLSGDVGGAFKAAAALHQKHPEDPVAAANLALLLQAQNRQKEVLTICQAMNERGLQTAPLKCIEATVYESRNPPDVKAAIAAYEEAMALDPKDWVSASNLGQLILRTDTSPKATPRAVTLFEEALRRAPNQIEPMLNLALAYARGGEKTKGRELAKHILKFNLPPANAIRQQAEKLVKVLA